jgi:hypothetical protein
MAIFAEWAFTKAPEEGKSQSRQIIYPRALAVLAGVAALVFFLIPKVTTPPSAATPVLQSLEAQPNYVRRGDRVKLTLQLDKPAPKDISVALTTSDPAILPLDGDVTVPEGSNMATVYSTAISAPNYAAPVVIYASYQDVKKRTQVNVAGQLKDSGSGNQVAMAVPAQKQSNQASLSVAPTAPAVTLPPKPLSGELLSRLEEAQGQLSAEKSYWENVKSHMPAGTSLRPEITSQLFAAESSGARCTKAEAANDATSLSACIDSLNDHLTQLKIQH